jgi:hypothetical protein
MRDHCFGWQAGADQALRRRGLDDGDGARAAPVFCVFRAKSAGDSGMKSATDSDLISAIPT